MGIGLIILTTAVAVLLLVAFSNRLFEENRTRVRRSGQNARRPEAAPATITAADGVEWRTLVGAGVATGAAAYAAPSAPRRDTVASAARPAGEFVEIRRAA